MTAFTGAAIPCTLQVTVHTLQEYTIIKNSFLREDLFIELLEKKDNAKEQVATIIQEKFENDCGTVNCIRQQDAVDMAQEPKKQHHCYVCSS